MSKVYALVDCNNFYASCEKLFRPDLKCRPVVVLSNNDGCVVARSAEAKALGIKMGVPIFQIRELIQKHRIEVFSSNYTLYADMSSRVMSILETLAPRVEVYSIDEAFLDASGIENALPLMEFGQQIRTTIQQWVGITVCVGMAPSKTLAKLANHAAKRYPATGGVVDLTAEARQKKLLALIPVGEIWGIGRRLSQRLNDINIMSALDLSQANPKTLRRSFSVVVERTVRELNGEDCLGLDEMPATKQQIVCSRSFGERITDFPLLREAVCSYVVRAAEKLRQEKQQAKKVTVFVRTGLFNGDEPQYSNTATRALVLPTDDSRELMETALQLLKGLWRPGFRYAKAGVMLTDFYDPDTFQPRLFDDGQAKSKSSALMSVVDSINQASKGRVWFAGQGTQKSWAMKRDRLSPAYTTQWSGILRVR